MPTEGMEGVEVVPLGLALPVRRLRGQLGTGGVHELAVRPHHVAHRRLREPLDLEVGHLLPQGPGDRQVPQHVPEPDR